MPARRGYKRKRGPSPAFSTITRTPKYRRSNSRAMVGSFSYSPAINNMRISGYVGRELKFLDSYRAPAAFTTTWSAMSPSTGVTDCLTMPAQGDGESNRDGRHYYIHGIYIRGTIQRAVVEADTAPPIQEHARIVLVWDSQTNATAVTATSVMDNGAGVDLNSFRNLQNSKRFKILYDKIFKINPQIVNEGAVNSFAAQGWAQHFKINKTFKTPIPVNCVATTAAVASCSDNSINMIGVASSTDITLTYDCRVRFTG